MIKLTVDGGLLREHKLLPAVQTLKKWETEGRIELIETDRAKNPPGNSWPGAAPAPSNKRRQTPFRRVKRESGGVTFAQLSTVIFPERDSNRLNMGEINDVAHLLQHHTSGNTIFITISERFTAQPKRDQLQAAFGIKILTPEEAVLSLQSTISKAPEAQGGNIG